MTWVALAIAAATCAGQAPETGDRDRSESPISFGIDATKLRFNFLDATADGDPSLLPFAPTSARTALAASAAATSVGAGMTLGFTALAVEAVGLPWTVPALGITLGVLLLNFGPNAGDALNGDWTRLLVHGLARLGLLVSAVFFPPIGLAWVGLLVADVAQSRLAPSRWAARYQEQALRRAAPPPGFSPGPP